MDLLHRDLPDSKFDVPEVISVTKTVSVTPDSLDNVDNTNVSVPSVSLDSSDTSESNNNNNEKSVCVKPDNVTPDEGQVKVRPSGPSRTIKKPERL